MRGHRKAALLEFGWQASVSAHPVDYFDHGAVKEDGAGKGRRVAEGRMTMKAAGTDKQGQGVPLERAEPGQQAHNSMEQARNQLAERITRLNAQSLGKPKACIDRRCRRFRTCVGAPCLEAISPPFAAPQTAPRSRRRRARHAR